MRLRSLEALHSSAERKISRYEWLYELIIRDEHTDLYNYRFLLMWLNEQFAKMEQLKLRTQRSSESFALLFIDIDRFKRINDRYGHIVGSKLLRQMGHLLQVHLPEGGFAVRYGGDEFVVVLPKFQKKKAFDVAEKIRQDIASTPFDVAGHRVKVTVSIGIALCPTHAATADEAIAAADRAMYAAKKSSRNATFLA